MFLRRSKIVPNVAKGKKPKKKEPEAKKKITEQENAGKKDVLETEANTSSQNHAANSVSNEENEAPVAGNIGDSIGPPPSTPSVPEPAIVPPSRSFLSSQDESASSADEANKKSKTVNLPKFRKYKPRITLGGNKVVHKPTPSSSQSQEALPQQNAPETSKSVSANDAKNTRTESMQLARPELSVSPSKHLVPAAPHCVPVSTEASSSEDEGVIDPYDPNNPQGPKSDTDRIRHRKNQRIKKTFVGGKPTAMIDYLFYNPKSNPMVHSQTEKVIAPDISRADEELEDEPDQQDDTMPVPAPQLIFGPDGKMVIDEKSLVIERKETREGREALYKTPVIESTGYYTAQRRRSVARKQWTNEETVFFYKCLNTVGPDFCLISKYFPGCTRHQIKLKFKLEERRNPLLVDKAFKFKTTFDTSEIDEEFEKIAEKALKDKEDKKKKRQAKGTSAKRGRKPQKKKKGPKGRKDYFLEDSSADEGEESEMEESEPELGSENDSETQDGEERKPTKDLLRGIKQEPKQGEQNNHLRSRRKTSVACNSQPEVSQSSEVTEEASGTVAYLDIAESTAVAERTLDPRELQVADVENIMNSDSQNHIDMMSSKSTTSKDSVITKSGQAAPAAPVSSATSVLAKFLTTQRAKAQNIAVTPDTNTSKTIQQGTPVESLHTTKSATSVLAKFLTSKAKNAAVIPDTRIIPQGTNTQVDPLHTTVSATPQSIPITSSATSMKTVNSMKITAALDPSSNNKLVSANTQVSMSVTAPTPPNTTISQSISVPIASSAMSTGPISTANITNVASFSSSSNLNNSQVLTKTNHIIVPTNKPDGSVINIINRAHKPETILGIETQIINFKPQASQSRTEVISSKSQSSDISCEQEESSSTLDSESPSKRPTTIHTILPTSTPGTVINIISKAQKPETILGPATPIFNSNILKLLRSPSVANVIKTASQQCKQTQSEKTGATVTRADHVVSEKNIQSKNVTPTSKHILDKSTVTGIPVTRTDTVVKNIPVANEKCVPSKVQYANPKQDKATVSGTQTARTDNNAKPVPVDKDVNQVEANPVCPIPEIAIVSAKSIDDSIRPSLPKEIIKVQATIEKISDNIAAMSDTCKSTEVTPEESKQEPTKELQTVEGGGTIASPANIEKSIENVNTIVAPTQNITLEEDNNMKDGLSADLPETQVSTPIKTPSPVKVPVKVLSFRRPNFKPLINKKIPNKDTTTLKIVKPTEKTADATLSLQELTSSSITRPVPVVLAKTQVNVISPPVTSVSATSTSISGTSSNLNVVTTNIPTTASIIKLNTSASTPIAKITTISSNSVVTKVASITSNSILSKIPSNTTNSILAKIASNSSIAKPVINTTTSTITSSSTSSTSTALASSSQSLENIIVLPTSTCNKITKIEKVSRRKAPLIIKIPFEEPCIITPEQLTEMEKLEVPEKRGRKRKDSVKELKPAKVSTSEAKSPPVQEPEVIEVSAESDDEPLAMETMSVDAESDSEKSESEESSDSDAKYLKKAPRPTRSGRVPKTTKSKEAPIEMPSKRKRKRVKTKTSVSAPASPEPHARPAKKRRSSVPGPPPPRPISPEPASSSEAESSFSEDPTVEGVPPPGSLIVCKSLDPVNNKETYTVFMIPPNTGGTTLEHNPDGTLQKLTVGSSAVAVLPASNSLPTLVPTSYAPNLMNSGLQMSAQTLEMLAHNVVDVEAERPVLDENTGDLSTDAQEATES